MGRFFSILVATFISVLGALVTWHFAKEYLTQLEAGKVAAEAIAEEEEKQKAVERIVDRIKYEWEVEERSNPVTGEKVVTATRFSKDIDSALTFRCYGLMQKRFDVLVSFPEAIEWISSTVGHFAEMKFKVDEGDIASIRVDRNSSAVAVMDLKEHENVEKQYRHSPVLLEMFTEQNRNIREFKKIQDATVFVASIPDGTIYQQTVSIDLAGIREAIKPVLALCDKVAM